MPEGTLSGIRVPFYLAYPAPDKALYLAANASETSVAAVLVQNSAANKMRLLGFFSH